MTKMERGGQEWRDRQTETERRDRQTEEREIEKRREPLHCFCIYCREREVSKGGLNFICFVTASGMVEELAVIVTTCL
ncbi:hypothetical protein ACQP3J_32200, partial [Escherichia coli]